MKNRHVGNVLNIRDLHDLVDEQKGVRVVTTGKSFKEDGKKFQPVKILRRGFRPVDALIAA